MNNIFSKTVLLFCISLCCISLQAQQKIIVEKLTETTKSWNGSELPAYHGGQPQVTILKITIPAKTKLKWHKHLVINAGILLSGELVVTDEHQNKKILKEGETLVELVNIYHYGENISDEDAVIVVFYAGTEGIPITVLKDGDTTEH